jgi:hypothetical protein
MDGRNVKISTRSKSIQMLDWNSYEKCHSFFLFSNLHSAAASYKLKYDSFFEMHQAMLVWKNIIRCELWFEYIFGSILLHVNSMH